MKTLLLWVVLPIISVVTVLVLGLFGIFHYLNGGDNPNDIPASQQPVLNPHPQYFMTVKGHIDPALLGRLKLNWGVSYVVNNSQCIEVTNRLEGAEAPLTLNKNHIIKQAQTGNFTYKVPLDKYLPGKCRWAVGGAGFEFYYHHQSGGGDANASVNFAKGGVKEAVPMEKTWHCGKRVCKLSPDSTLYVSENVSEQFSNTVILNFKSME